MGKSGGGGGGGSTAGPEAERLARVQADIAQNLFNMSDPLRQGVISHLGPAVGQAFQPIDFSAVEGSPLYPAIKTATERQFDLGRDRIMADTPSGGALTAALGGLEANRAGALASGQGAIAEQEFNRRQLNLDRAIGVGTGGAAQGLAGLGQSSNIFAGIQGQQLAAAQSRANADQAKSAGTGQLVGTAAVLGAKALMCSRDAKDVVADIEDDAAIEQMQSLRTFQWRYKGEAQMHVGPMAEDFQAAFGVGDGRHIEVIDAIGVLMGAVAALTRKIEALEAR